MRLHVQSVYHDIFRDRCLHNMTVFCLSRIGSLSFSPCSVKRSVNMHDIFVFSFLLRSTLYIFSLDMGKVDPYMFTRSCQVSIKYLSTKCASIADGTFCTLFDNEWL